MTITLPLNLSSVGVSPGENTQHLDSIGPDGLTLVSGFSIGSGIGISPFDPISVPALLDGLNPAATSQGYLTQNATTANFGHLHLVAGETLTINYDFKPGDDYFNDFAWQVIGQGAADEQATLLANVQQVVNNNGATDFHSTTTINQTGDYDLLLGVSDIGDNQKHSTLVVHNITITAPDNIYTADPNGLRLSDGSKILANGGLLLPNGVAESNVISPGGQALISFLISQDGGGLVGNAGGTLISQDGGGLVGNAGGTLISQDGGGVVSNDGGSLISQDGGGLISQDGGGFIGHNGSSVVSNDGGSLVGNAGGTFHVNAFKSVDTGPTGQDLIVTTGFLDKSTAAGGDTINVSYQIKSDGTEAAAASTSKVYLSTDDTITTSDQLLGSLPDPSLAVGTSISDTIDVKLPSGLAAGTYYLGVIADADGQVTEGDETNNVSSRFAVTVTDAADGSGSPPTPVAFTKIPTDAADGAAPRALATGDVNGDGKTDIVTADFQSDTVSVLIGAGDGTFAKSSIPFQGGHAGVVLADVNGDGKLDIVTADYDNDTASVLIGHGDGTFSSPTSMAVGHNPYNLSVADVTGDGIADLLVANSGAFTVSLLKGNGDGTFQPATQIARSTSPGFVVVADINKDGQPDLVTTDYNDGTATVLIGQSGGAFQAQAPLAVGANPVSAVVADVNGDGNLDIVVGNNQDASVSVLLGQGDGTFQSQIKIAVGTNPLGLAVHDLNGDGRPDIVTGNYGDSSASILLGNGDGTFTAQTPIAVGASPFAAAIADFNGDGKPDIATANYLGDSVSILLNQTVPASPGGGTTPPPPVDTTPTVPSGGTAPTLPGGSDAAAGTHDASYVDVYGNTVVDTSDAQDRLVKEVITGTDGNLLSTETLSYAADGTYTTHSDLLTTAGSVSVDAAYGVLGELSESVFVDGKLSSTATVTYNPDGSILRHSVTVGQPGSEDLLYGRTGTLISDTHVDTGGTPTVPIFVASTAPTHIVAPDVGTNVIDGHAGASDTLVGGSGTDTVSYAASTTAVAIGLEVNATWDGAHADTLSSIENAIGSPFDDVLVGGDGNNVLDGGPAGADLISGGLGIDTVSYASSHAAVIVDLGAQLTWDGSVNDQLSSIENAIGSRFDDILVGDDGNNVLDGGAGGADLIGGGVGSDTVSYASSHSGVIIDLGAQITWDGSVNDTLSSIENAIGSRFDDTIVGDGGDNVLDGGAGGADHIIGGLGTDTASYVHSASAVSIDLGAQITWDGSVNDTLSSIENAIGSRFDDTIVGDDGNNVLDGGAGGADHISGGLGVDTVSYANSKMAVSIDLAAQVTWDGVSNDTLSSIESAIGSQFADTLTAGGGTSVLTGGGGSDTFAFRAGFVHAVITDFAAGGSAQDVIQLDHGLFANDDPLSAAHDIGGDVVLAANGGADVTLLGLHKADLAMTDFHFV